jgi:hypothetical protein
VVNRIKGDKMSVIKVLFICHGRINATSAVFGGVGA